MYGFYGNAATVLSFVASSTLHGLRRHTATTQNRSAVASRSATGLTTTCRPSKMWLTLVLYFNLFDSNYFYLEVFLYSV